MELRIKKRIVGFLLLIALGLIFIPLFFGRSLTSNELKLSNYVPERPKKPAELAMPIPSQEATIQNIKPSPVPQSTSSKSPPSRIVFEQMSSSANAGNTTTKSTKPTAPPQSTTQKTLTDEIVGPTLIPPPEMTTNTSAPIAVPQSTSPETANTSTTKSKPAPIAPAVVSTPKKVVAAKPGAWVVQVGSFADKANAEMLMKKIQAAGFPAYLESSKSNAVRVLVGPELLKSSADAMQAKLAEKLQITGIIVKATK